MSTRSAQTRDKVLTAAQEAILESGIAQFTIEAVAKRSGVAKTTIYRHWPSGQELVVECIDCMVEPMPTPNTGSLMEDLRSFYGHILEVSSNPEAKRLFLALLARSFADPDLAALQDRMTEERSRPLLTVLELARGRGDLRPDIDLHDAMAMIEGPFFFRMMVERADVDTEWLDLMLRRVVAALESD